MDGYHFHTWTDDDDRSNVDSVVLDAEVAPFCEAMAAFAVTADAVSGMRAAPAGLSENSTSDPVERADHIVSEDPAVVVRSYRPRNAAAVLPCVYWIHGGGYVVGNYEMDDARLARWSVEFQCVVTSVEYRLAPETAYPGPLDDCFAGLQWVFEHADELGVDRERVGLGGISAGGGLAAGLALLARDRSLRLSFQLLESPMLDDRQVTSSSQLDGLPIWSRESNEFGWRSYLGDLYGRDDLPPYAAPARAADLVGLPPTFVIVGGADGFRDENIEYALRLNQAGVPTELHVLPGAPHGVASLFGSTSIAVRWETLVGEWLGRQLET
ncbi:MAG: alpha/beta hydrolase [Acidimicrobiia bacterium]